MASVLIDILTVIESSLAHALNGFSPYGSFSTPFGLLEEIKKEKKQR
jgi:hypothetical protein